eukprot:CAMPEP_0181334400 /NCGR_PEP_ID=MMETSP1101-20121128/26233_1 /TAXON_ID=46948 /ORGANISM="Rhodomonas abbreviata, Strain Caron Lab Isolate" /LENGTH=857 /DNA_ID=CAMNT_0023444361 /DNA_START=63 /DNA_END=2636 /DNA_ORIENTATION=+
MSNSDNHPAIIRLNPTQYAHVLDNNTNVTRVLIGPLTHARQDHETKVFGPAEMVLVPPRQYCVVKNPVVRDESGKAKVDPNNLQVKLQYGEEEIRLEGPPFPLYPGEQMPVGPTPLRVVPPQSALRLLALRDHTDGSEKRVAGDEWQFKGPATYVPRVEVKVVDTVHATVVQPGRALRLQARQALEDSDGKVRKAGEEWLMNKAGAYLPGVFEVVLETVEPLTLTDKRAIHLRALRTFEDEFGKQRRAGEEWLLTMEDCETHIPDVNEEIINPELPLIVLTRKQYCVVLNAWDETGKQMMGRKELRRGERSFFLKPGEELENGVIKDVAVLGDDEALLLKAVEPFSDAEGVERTPGDRWNIIGPCEYVPPVEVEVLKRYSSVPLDENEGIYVRNIKTGKVDTVIGQTYLLKPDEELWEKVLPDTVERLIQDPHGTILRDVGTKAMVKRDKTRVVTFRAPHNTAVQVYDYKEKSSRVTWGPGLVMLGPDEQFTLLSLSGGTPKEANVIKCICLRLGPDFMTDVVVVETSDHARLSIQLSYNWHFAVESNAEGASKIFQVPDFVGDTCKSMASRVRGAVAGATFDDFHKHSTTIIHAAVFGKDASGAINKTRNFSENNLVITNVDIQSVEPVDQRTRDALSYSVQQAIEITTKSQEANARHEAERQAQEAQGRLERQRLKDEVEAEKARQSLLELQAESSAVQSMGHAKAEARARAEATQIEKEAELKQAELRVEAKKIQDQWDLQQVRDRQAAEIAHQKAVNDMQVQMAKEMAQIETDRFKNQVDAIGAETIKSMAQAGPELQAKLLQGLGLKSVLITDGSSPVNLFNTANGLIGAQPAQGGGAPALPGAAEGAGFGM